MAHFLEFLMLAYVIYYLEYRLWQVQRKFSDQYNMEQQIKLRRNKDHKTPFPY